MGPWCSPVQHVSLSRRRSPVQIRPDPPENTRPASSGGAGRSAFIGGNNGTRIVARRAGRYHRSDAEPKTVLREFAKDWLWISNADFSPGLNNTPITLSS